MIRRPGLGSAVFAATLVAAAAGLAVGTWLVEPEPPAELHVGMTATAAPVVARDIVDAVPVTLRVSVEPGPSVRSPSAGRLTAMRCVAGDQVESGTSVLSIDGRTVVALATGVPLWRNLRAGDRGPDVAALHAELARLGFGDAQGDRVRPSTLTAFTRLVRSVEQGTGALSEVDLASVMWLPAPSVTVDSCNAEVGQRVEAEDPVIGTTGLVSLELSSEPTASTDGERDLVIDGTRVPIDRDGVVRDTTAVAAVLSTDAYRSAPAEDDGSRRLTASWELRDPITVSVVPPAAIAAGQGEESCVRSADDPASPPVAVRVVGSGLGQTFVVPATEVAVPGTVTLDVDEVGCR